MQTKLKIFNPETVSGGEVIRVKIYAKDKYTAMVAAYDMGVEFERAVRRRSGGVVAYCRYTLEK